MMTKHSMMPPGKPRRSAKENAACSAFVYGRQGCVVALGLTTCRRERPPGASTFAQSSVLVGNGEPVTKLIGIEDLTEAAVVI